MEHVSTLTLHQYRYGELSSERMAEIRTHVDDCEQCRARLMAQEHHRTEFELRPVPEAIRTATRPRRSRWWLGLALPLAAAAVGLLFLAPDLGDDTAGDWLGVPLIEHTTKGQGVDEVPVGRQTADGADGIQAFLDEGDEPRLITTADVLRPGDRVQLRYRTADRAMVTFAGRDGAGRLEVYGAVEAVADGDWHRAPMSLVLDRTPGDQVFFTVYSDDLLDSTGLAEALADERALPGTDVVGIVLPKTVE